MADRLPTLEKAFRRHPDAPLFARLADAYLRRGEGVRALEVCEKGCERFPEYATGFQVLSRCYEAHGDLDKARRAMSRALRLDPQNPAGFRRLSHLHGQLGNAQLALRSLKQALRLDPLSAGLTEELGQVAHRAWAEAQQQAGETFDLLPSEVAEAPPDGPAPAQVAPAAAAPLVADGPPAQGAEAPPVAAAAEAVPEAAEAQAADGARVDETEVAEDGASDQVTGLGLREDAELGRLLQEIDSQQARAQAVQAEPVPAPQQESVAAQPEAEVEGPIPRIVTVTLARIYSLQGLNQRAIEVLRQVLERDPGNAPARDELAALEGRTKGHQ